MHYVYFGSDSQKPYALASDTSVDGDNSYGRYYCCYMPGGLNVYGPTSKGLVGGWWYTNTYTDFKKCSPEINGSRAVVAQRPTFTTVCIGDGGSLITIPNCMTTRGCNYICIILGEEVLLLIMIRILHILVITII